jgi:putative endonuclease
LNREAAEKRGRGAETLACWWLRLHGWRILARGARVPGGEVEIVARRRGVVAFIEVKARRTSEAAAMSLDAWRLRRVVAAAERLSPRWVTMCGSTRSSSCLDASRITCPMSGMGDKVLSLA